MFDDRGRETPPTAIEPVSKPGALEKTYFPYTTPWRQAFRIRFAAADDHGPTITDGSTMVGLRFSGPQGRQDVTWQLDANGRGKPPRSADAR